jgi:hypothetical protein
VPPDKTRPGPEYTSVPGWLEEGRSPLMAAAVGGAFLVQAVYFTKQLVQGESEFEE